MGQVVAPTIQAVMVHQMAAVYPYITEMATAIPHDAETTTGSRCDDQFEFEFGLDLILDRLERLIVSG